MTKELKSLAEEILLTGKIYQLIGEAILHNHKSDVYDKYVSTIDYHFRKTPDQSAVMAGALYAMIDEMWRTGECRFCEDVGKSQEELEAMCEEYIQKAKKWCEVFKD